MAGRPSANFPVGSSFDTEIARTSRVRNPWESVMIYDVSRHRSQFFTPRRDVQSRGAIARSNRVEQPERDATWRPFVCVNDARIFARNRSTNSLELSLIQTV